MGLVDDILGRHNRAVAKISGGNMSDLRDVGKAGEIAAIADEFGKHALPGATPVVVQPQRLIRRRRVSAWQQHGGRSISGKLMGEQKRLSQKDDFWSKAGAFSAGALGGGLSFFEMASDILPGKRFEGRRHDIPGLLDKDTTWAFRAGAAATMLIPVAGPASAAGRGTVGVGMRIAPRITTKAGIAAGKGVAAAGRGTRATGRLVIGTGKRAGRLAVKPVTIPVKAAIGSGKYIIRKGGKVYRFTTLKAASAFVKKPATAIIRKPTTAITKTTTRPGYAGRQKTIEEVMRPGTNAFGIIIPKQIAKTTAKTIPRTVTKVTPKATTKTGGYARGLSPAAKKVRASRAAAKAARKRNGISGGQASSYFAKVDPLKTTTRTSGPKAKAVIDDVVTSVKRPAIFKDKFAGAYGKGAEARYVEFGERTGQGVIDIGRSKVAGEGLGRTVTSKYAPTNPNLRAVTKGPWKERLKKYGGEKIVKGYKDVKRIKNPKPGQYGYDPRFERRRMFGDPL